MPVETSMQKASVGRIVHFYDPARKYNGIEGGPFAAIVTQVFDGPYVNLTVLPPFNEAYFAGSVSHKSELREGSANAYWEWPPIVVAGSL